MGSDYSTLQLFTGKTPPAIARQALLKAVVAQLSAEGFQPIAQKTQFHNRVVVIGPAEDRPWLSIYDSCGSRDEDSEFELLYEYREFIALAQNMSAQVGPVVRIDVDDGCALKFRLFADGKQVDQYADQPTIGEGMYLGGWSDEKRLANRSRPNVWGQHLKLSSDQTKQLRQIWPRFQQDQRVYTGRILSNTAELLGWNKRFARTGYAIGADGIPVHYSVPLSYAGVDLAGFTELYFYREKSAEKDKS